MAKNAFASTARWLSLITFCLSVWIVVQIPDGKLHVIFCDVGQGDAELIVKGSTQILIDGGPRGDKVLECLGSHMPFWDRKIEVIMASHSDSDHVKGLSDVINRYAVGDFVKSGWLITPEAEDIKKLLVSKGIKVHQVMAGNEVKVSGIDFKVLWPDNLTSDASKIDENKNGLVVRLTYGRFTAIFTGDIGTAEELALMGSGVIIPTTVLKVAHHGSFYSSSIDFVAKLRPKLAVFEVGAKNTYGHPNGDILKRFDTVGTKIKRTDKDGSVEAISDGKVWWLSKK